MTDKPLSLQQFIQQRNAEIAYAYAEGQTLSEIAARHEIAESTVIQIASHCGAHRPKKLREPKPPKEKKPNPYAERNAQMLADYQTGRSLEDVAKQYGITRERVRQLLVKQGFADRHNGVMMPERVAVRDRRNAHAEKVKARAAHRAARANQARELYLQGKTYREISETMGVGVGYIEAVVADIMSRRPQMIGRPKVKLTEAQVHEIGNRYVAGEDVRKIAQDYNICAGYVRTLSVNHGYRRACYRKPLVELKPPTFAAPRKLPVPHGSADWTEEEAALAREMRAQGKSASDIAEVLGRTRNSVIGKWQRMGLAVSQEPIP